MIEALSIDSFLNEVSTPSRAADVAAVINRLSFDPTLEEYHQRLRSIPRTTSYWDLACALNYLAERHQPRTYLEIGVRRGKSMAQVVTRQPSCDIVGIDFWLSPYGGVENPGPDFVRTEMSGLGHRGSLTLLSGDSRTVLPRLIAEDPKRRFDLITVDGDHTDEGAWADLTTTVGLLNPGGWLLFDDLVHPLHTLLPVWEKFRDSYALEIDGVHNAADHTGTAVARRRT